MKVIFMGTPDFSVGTLEALVEARHEVVLAVTQPDKPKGRGKEMQFTPVKECAMKYQIPVYQPVRVREAECIEELRKYQADIMVVVAFGQILPKEILEMTPYGCVNVHASLLPKYRGASPIHYALLNGEKESGITIMRTDEGIDTGDIIVKSKLEIFPNETCGELFDRLSILGADLIVETLPKIFSGQAKFIKQNNNEASYTKIIRKQDSLIIWEDSAENIFNKIRAFNPSPIAYCMLNGEPFKIFNAKTCDIQGKCGEILKADNELIIGCGHGALSLLTVQKAGGKVMDIGSFLRGNKLTKGEILK